LFIVLTPLLLALPRQSEAASPDTPKQRPAILRTLPILFLTAWLTMSAAYLFAGSFQPLSSYHFRSAALTSIQRHFPRSLPILLPKPYVMCLDDALHTNRMAHPAAAYLMGRFSKSGFIPYYPVAFGVKTTCGFLFLIALTVLTGIRSTTRFSRDEWLLILPVSAFFLYFTFFGTVHIGLRYILPVYPLLAILASRTMKRRSSALRFPWPAALLIALHVVESAAVHPHYLEFFNWISGGPENGYRWLSDSNLCWGQDIGLLRIYQQKHGIRLKLNARQKSGGCIALNTNRYMSPRYAWI
jgi:hypothetical protein